MTQFYIEALNYKSNLINGEIFNVGYENLKIKDIAAKVKAIVKKDVEMETTPSNDNRSYHISSRKIQDKLKFKTKYTVDDAIYELHEAFKNKIFLNTLDDIKYFNIKVMQKINLE